MKYTPPAEPSRNGHTSRLPSDFAQAARLMTRRPLPAKPLASQGPPEIPVPAREDRYLSDAHIAELEASGIPAEYALDNGVYTEDDPEALAALLNWKSVSPERGSGLVFLSHDEDGNVVGVTVKFDHPRPDPDKPGKVVKYEWRSGCPTVPYISPATRAVLGDPTVEVGVTEGVKKAMAAECNGTRFVAIPGVTMWGKGGELHADLAAIARDGRSVPIAFDSDAAKNKNVRLQEQKLAAAMTKRGAIVTVVRLPPGTNGKKVGLDDYIVAHGTDALRQLMADAHRTQHPTPNDGEPLGTNPTTQQEPNGGDPSPDSAGVGCWALGGGQAVPFPVGVLPVVLATFVRAVAAALPCPPDYIGVLMLAVLGTLIGRKRCVQVKQGWREFAVFWVLFVGRSGSKKTPADTHTTGPLHARQRALADEYKRELADWLKLPPQERQDTPKPVLRQVVATNTTMEGLTSVLPHSPGLMLTMDEILAFARGMGQYKGGGGDDRQQWLSLWSLKDLVITRKGSDTAYIRNPFVCVGGGIQPDVVGDLIGDTREDGLSARFLVSYPDPLPPADWTEEDVPNDDEYRAVCDALWEMEPADDPISLTPQAKAVWVEWYNAHQRDEPPDPLRPFWSKCEGYCLRLALVLFLSRHAAGETDAEELDAESMAGAVELIRYFQAHARRVYGTAAVRDGGRIANALAWVRKRGGEVSARLIRQNEVSGAKTKEAAEQLLHDLADLGHGTLTTPPGKSPVFRLGQPDDQPDDATDGDEGGAE